MIYYKQGTGTYVVTEPRPWARENQHLFPHFDFVNNHHFEIDVETAAVVVIQNLDPYLVL